MHTGSTSHSGASHWLVIVAVALACAIAIAAWRWISPQRMARVPASPAALPSISVPKAKTSIPAAAGRQAMAGSDASAEIEQRVQRLAEASRRTSPDVSQFPAADSNNDAWPAVPQETQGLAVASAPQVSGAEARTEQVNVEPDARPEAQTAVPQGVREETAVSSAEIDVILAAAHADLARDRLTTPAGANALERFQAVLARDPSNADAKSGLHLIVTKYLALAKRVAGDGRFDLAESFLQRAQRVGMNEDAVLAAQQQLAEMRANR